MKNVYKKKVRNKKTSRRYKKKYRKTININRALQPVAQRTIVKMKYSETITASALYGLTLYRYNLNSIYDPNLTGTGHQPYGHDTFQSLYNRYRVINCHYSISAVSAAGATIAFCALPSNESFGGLTNMSEWREKPRCRYAIQTPGAAIKKVSGNVYIPSLMGRTKNQYMADDRYQSEFGASPAEAAVLNIAAQSYSEGVSDSNVYFNIQLVYTVECFDVKTLAQS